MRLYEKIFVNLLKDIGANKEIQRFKNVCDLIKASFAYQSDLHFKNAFNTKIYIDRYDWF